MKKRIFLLVLGAMILLAGWPGSMLAAKLPSDAFHGLLETVERHCGDNVVVDVNVRVPVPGVGDKHPPVDLGGTVIRHTDAPRPTILVATPYRRELVLTLYAELAAHGYNVMGIDLRGTGSSAGDWLSFGPVEHYDTAHVIDAFIPSRDWSDGRVGMIGPSYMGIIQLLASGHVKTHADGTGVHLKALFPIVAMSDAYRDIVFHGGNMNLAFIPMWLGFVEILANLPPLLMLGEDGGPNLNDIAEAMEIWREHLAYIPVPISWVMNHDNTFKTDFYETRSPMIYWPQKPGNGWGFPEGDNTIPPGLPVFMVGGWLDIFTRGTCNHYTYGLAEHSDSDKAMIIGPWYHLDGAMGLGVESLGSLELAARWFDWKIKGEGPPFMEKYPVIIFVGGENRWRAEQDWPLPPDRVEPKTLYLSKKRPSKISWDWFSELNKTNNYALVENPRFHDYYQRFLLFRRDLPNPVLRHDPPVYHGLVSRATTRWIMGLPALGSQYAKLVNQNDIDHLMPWEDERLDELGVLTFTTEPLSADLEITGPIKLTFWAKTAFNRPLTRTITDATVEMIKTAFNVETNLILDFVSRRDVQWVVEINDVHKNGRAASVTSGWLSAWHRPYDPENPTRLDPGYTAFDPFYSHPDKTPAPIEEDRVYPYVVELWPTAHTFKKGHRIRVSISASDFPHLLPIAVPSKNTIVIDGNHKARIEFTAVRPAGDYMWIDDIDDYLMNHADW